MLARLIKFKIMEYIKTKRILKKGQPGTKKLERIYGDDLVCVRYKYDYKNKKRYKTVELIVDSAPWTPNRNDTFSNRKICVQIHYGESELAKYVKESGGVWVKAVGLWLVPLQAVIDLRIECHVVKNKAIYRTLYKMKML